MQGRRDSTPQRRMSVVKAHASALAKTDPRCTAQPSFRGENRVRSQGVNRDRESEGKRIVVGMDLAGFRVGCSTQPKLYRERTATPRRSWNALSVSSRSGRPAKFDDRKMLPPRAEAGRELDDHAWLAPERLRSRATRSPWPARTWLEPGCTASGPSPENLVERSGSLANTVAHEKQRHSAKWTDSVLVRANVSVGSQTEGNPKTDSTSRNLKSPRETGAPCRDVFAKHLAA